MFAYLRIAGPVGPARKDFDLAQLSMYAGSPYPKKVTHEDFLPQWARPRLIDD
jgi:hypothetical protein